MANNVLIVSAVLTPQQRAEILSRVTPAFSQVYCMQLTWAYRVTPEFTFPRGEIELGLDALYTGPDADALTGWLHNGTNLHHERLRPDGKPVYVTLSTQPGTPPSEAMASLRSRTIRQEFAPIVLKIRLARRNATTLRPVNMAA